VLPLTHATTGPLPPAAGVQAPGWAARAPLDGSVVVFFLCVAAPGGARLGLVGCRRPRRCLMAIQPWPLRPRTPRTPTSRVAGVEGGGFPYVAGRHRLAGQHLTPPRCVGVGRAVSPIQLCVWGVAAHALHVTHVAVRRRGWGVAAIPNPETAMDGAPHTATRHGGAALGAAPRWFLPASWHEKGGCRCGGGARPSCSLTPLAGAVWACGPEAAATPYRHKP